jgi:vacuolar-type H+-ATPase subunit H
MDAGSPGKTMEDTGVLQHLLEIESQASVLVDDARAEADKRIKTAEEQNRLRYDKQYQDLVQKLEAEYLEQVQAVRAEYRQSLEEYRKSLDFIPLDRAAFSALVSQLLTGGT